jgi:hypothetical protein
LSISPLPANKVSLTLFISVSSVAQQEKSFLAIFYFLSFFYRRSRGLILVLRGEWSAGRGSEKAQQLFTSHVVVHYYCNGYTEK